MVNRLSFFKATPFRTGCLVILLSSVLYFSIARSNNALLLAFDAQVFNTMFKIRGSTATTGKVAIVDIDEKSLAMLGQWPWSRDKIATLVGKIDDAGANVIGLDMIFPEKDRTSPSNWFHQIETASHSQKTMPGLIPLKNYLIQKKEFDYDAILGDALFQSSAITGFAFTFSQSPEKVKTSTPFSSAHIRTSPAGISFDGLSLPVARSAVLNIPEVSQGESEGFINFFPGATGTVHKVPFFISLNSIPYPSLALEMARQGIGARALTIHASRLKKGNRHAVLGVSIDKHFIPTDTQGRITLNYRGGTGTFPYYSAVDVYDGKNGFELKDKYVLVGTSAAGLPDLRATPFSNVFPGVEVHATIIDNILAKDPFCHDRFAEIGITFLMIIAGGMILNLVLVLTGPLISAATGLFFIVISLWGNYHFFFLNNQLVGSVYPLFTVVLLFTMVTLAQYFYKDREKKFIHNAFAHYISPKLVDQLVKEPARLSLKGEQKELTIFFSDIRNFTAISEGMDSQRLAAILNQYLTAMSNIVMAHHGMVDKYIGDAVMAIWGAPLDDPNHAMNALRASLEMTDKLNTLNQKWVAEGFPPLGIGIGLNTGLASVGNFGSAQRFDYTVIGDNVNLASRLESLNKYYGTTILVSEETLKRTGDRFFSRFVDIVRVKGMKTPVRIYEPICEGEPAPEQIEKAAAFDEATGLYRSGAFEKARQMFLMFQQQEKHVINEVYLHRIDYFMKNAPPTDWDGVFTFNQK